MKKCSFSKVIMAFSNIVLALTWSLPVLSRTWCSSLFDPECERGLPPLRRNHHGSQPIGKELKQRIHGKFNFYGYRRNPPFCSIVILYTLSYFHLKVSRNHAPYKRSLTSENSMNSDCSTLKQKVIGKVCFAGFLAISSVYQYFSLTTFLVKRRMLINEAENLE